MPLYKIGTTYFNQNERALYLLQGNVIRDGESAPVNGKDHARTTVAAITNQVGDTLFVTLNGWRDRASQVEALRKGESVLAIGPLSIRDYNGKNYYDLDADFICLSGAGIFCDVNDGYSGGEPKYSVSPTFSELEDEAEGQLPF